MSKKVKSGLNCLEIQLHPDGLNSLVCALLCCRARYLKIVLSYDSSLYDIWCGVILEELEKLGCYAMTVPKVIQHHEVFRRLTHHVRSAIVIHHPDGFRQTYPYTYRMNEPAYQIYRGLDGYASVLEVCKMLVPFTRFTVYLSRSTPLRIPNRSRCNFFGWELGTHREESV